MHNEGTVNASFKRFNVICFEPCHLNVVRMFYVRPMVTTELLTQKMFIKVQVYGYTVLCRDMTYHEGSKIT
jgi:hypothetical protein